MPMTILWHQPRAQGRTLITSELKRGVKSKITMSIYIVCNCCLYILYHGSNGNICKAYLTKTKTKLYGSFRTYEVTKYNSYIS
jgi:hypothetical protein